MELTWLGEPTADALRAALRTVAPDLAEAPIVPRGLEPTGDPQYCMASAVVGGRFVVKFAWAGPAALRNPSGAAKLLSVPAAGVSPARMSMELTAFSLSGRSAPTIKERRAWSGGQLEAIADPVGHRTTIVTQKAYRHQLRPVRSKGVTTMSTIFTKREEHQAG